MTYVEAMVVVSKSTYCLMGGGQSEVERVLCVYVRYAKLDGVATGDLRFLFSMALARWAPTP